MTHQDCQDRLLDLAYGELGPSEVAEVEAHLEGCETCRAELARLGGTRTMMRRLEPEPPPQHGEHLVLTAARQAAERRRARRAFLPPWIWRMSLTAAALVVVGTVSYRILQVRDRPLSQEIEGRPEAFAARTQKGAPAAAVTAAPSTEVKGAVGPEQPAGRLGQAPESAGSVAPKKADRAAQAPYLDAEREASPNTGRFAESPQQPGGRGTSRRSAAKDAFTAPAERPERADAETSRDRSATDSRRFAKAPPPPAPVVSQSEATAAPSPQALAAPSAKPKSVDEEKSKKAEATGPLVDSTAVGGAATGRMAQASRPEPSSAAEPIAEPAAPPAPQENRAAPAPAEAAPGAPLLTARTWQRDRRVRAIQKLVREIDEAQRHRRLAEASRPFQACGPGEDAERRLYSLEGRTVKYVRQVGNRNLALTIEQLYDGERRLRYVFIHGGAVNGAVVDHRLWLDEEGRRLWEEQKWRRGRYPLPEVWPEKELALQAPGAEALECGAP
jgi:hypothetical protein